MENGKSQRREPPMVVMALWVILCFYMWSWAILCPLFVVLGALSLVLDLRNVIDVPGETTGEKGTFLTLMAVLAFVGLGFVWLRRRGRLKFVPEE